jgi:pyrimidine-nucleoside phosphorylase
MIHLSGQTSTVQEAYQKATYLLESGAALKKFEQLCDEQSGQLPKLELAQHHKTLAAKTSGFLTSYNVEKIGLAGIQLKAGRMQTTDLISPESGIEFHFKIGDAVAAGDPVYTIHGNDPQLFADAAEMLQTSFTINTQPTHEITLIKEVLNPWPSSKN